jgi:hypothetical protein
MRPIEFIATLTGGVLIATLLYSLAALHVPQPEKPVVEYKDFVSILLTAVALVVAVLAIGIGVLAIWGYKEFMSKAHDAARDVADESFKSYIGSPAHIEALAKMAEPHYLELARAAITSNGEQSVAHDASPTIIPPAP